MPEAEGRRREREAPLRGKRLLVVDDNRDAAESLAGLLGLLGADVQVVFSGEEALPAMRAHRPLAVLLDIGMPGMNGHEVARSIRTDPAFKDVMLIALTGWGQESDRLQSQAAGFDHHLIKPADMMVLQSLLEPLDDAPGQKNGIRNVRP
jgi:CheY-like chemotaxis protein